MKRMMAFMLLALLRCATVRDHVLECDVEVTAE